MVPLQLDWVVDTNPRLLPVWLIALGLEAMFLGLAWQLLRRADGYQQVSSLERALAVGGIGLGYLFLTLSVLRTAYGGYAAYLYLLFRGVEGVAATHIYLKLYDVLQGRGFGGSLAARAKHLLAVFFVLALGGYLVLKALVGQPRVGGVWYDLSMVYTVGVATLTFLAVRWRYRNVAAELNDGIVLGLALCIAGAHIFGFSLPGEVLLTLGGGVAYSAGFWGSAVLLWGQVASGRRGQRGGGAGRSGKGGQRGGPGQSRRVCPHCGQSLPSGTANNFCPHCGKAV